MKITSKKLSSLIKKEEEEEEKEQKLLITVSWKRREVEVKALNKPLKKIIRNLNE